MPKSFKWHLIAGEKCVPKIQKAPIMDNSKLTTIHLATV